jgi:isoleucyl-tRNA synthetase
VTLLIENYFADTFSLSPGLIQHRRRPTYYSPSSRTALAEAELSYKDDHISHSVYVFFEVPLDGMSRTLRRKVERMVGKGPVGLAIWTTTPWTLTANQAVAVAPHLEYVLVRQEGSDRVLIIAKDRLTALERHLGSLEILEELSGEELLGTSYRHLFWRDGLAVPQVIASKYVTIGAGTGLVHSAPGHGQEDYEIYREAFSDRPEADDIRCPVNDEGNLTEEILQWTANGVDGRSLVGKAVLGDAVPQIVELLKRHEILLAEEVIQHRYPCDWKTKEPIIIRFARQM